MGRNVFFLFWLWTFPAWASCVTMDTSTWTQAEKNLRVANAYRMAFLAGTDEVPTVSGDVVCFPTLDPTTVLNVASLKAAIDANIVQATQQLAQPKLDLQAKLTQLQTAYTAMTPPQQQAPTGLLLQEMIQQKQRQVDQLNTR